VSSPYRSDVTPQRTSSAYASITVPLGTLALVLAGMGSLARHRFRDRVGLLLVLNWAVLMVVRALPSAPGHDGERQLLPAFFFLACIAGVGAEAVRGWASRGLAINRRGSYLAHTLVGAAILASAASTWLYHPLQLSYYNVLIGGLPGAVQRGMEPTYYWDALTGDALGWINAHTSEDEKVMFSTYPYSLDYLRRWGRLKPAVLPGNPGEWKWYVLQLRPGSYRPADWWLTKNATPVYQKKLRETAWWSRGPWRLDVPLVNVYSFADYQRAVAGAGARDES